MRLLKCENGKLSLTKDLLGDHIPAYAILSHTWGPDSEEVTYQDLVNGTGKDKGGYSKLHFCADQAQRDGLVYFWIDTCCIDKANNTELTEAINSMFRWYRKAARCYVYLSDVSTAGCESGLPPSSPPSWETSFRASRWFTRGWTLQELLAPASVQFFTPDGALLGDKISLYQQIHETTGIAVSALQGRPLSSFSIEERFGWAERRRTTREEDSAYSLLGIFDVFISPIYGEGKGNAVRRLRGKINDTLGGASVLSPNDSAAFAISFSLSEVIEVEHFVAREEELARIQYMLGQGRHVSGRRTAVVHGLGGIGKTQLAVAYAKRHRDDYSAVFWLNARDEATLKQGFARVAERILREHPSVVYLANTVQSRDLDEAVAAVKRWLDQRKNDRWLIIYDNYDNPALNRSREGRPAKELDVDEADSDMNAVSQCYDIRRFLPETHHGAVLITTRSAQVKVGRQIPLGKLQELKDSLNILANTSDRQDLDKGM
jgi:hypothetical protein